MPIERAVYHSGSWGVYWTAPGAAPPPVVPIPIASFTATQQKPSATVLFDGSSSSETGGTISTWTWSFGDGSADVTGSANSTSHTYAKSGTYNVTLTVIDLTGQRAQTTRSVAVTLNVVPVASFVTSTANLTVSVDAGASSDPDGVISTYDWNFGDGATATGITASHNYATGGNYTIGLKVTDNLGAFASTTHSVTLVSGPIANFTATTSGLTASVNGSSSTDPNPISSYDWNWGESMTIPIYSFDTANDSHTVTLQPSSGNVLQNVVKNTVTGNIYSSQARNGTNGTASPYESVQISRMDSTGALIDTMELLNGGHPTDFAMEYTGGKTYIWIAWQEAASGGMAWDMCRIPYPVGGGTFSRTSPPPGMTIPYPGGVNRNGAKTDLQFDVQKDRVAIRHSDATGFNTFRQGVLSDFLAGTLTIYNTLTIPVSPPTLQGYFTFDYSLFIYWGAAYTQTSGSPAVSPTDPPVLKEYRWYDGVEIASYDPSWWGQPYANSHYEPEGASLVYPAGGSPSAWVGFITGTTNAYKYDILNVPLIAGTQSVPLKHSSGVTAGHTYLSAGTYNVTLAIKDAVNQTATTTKAVTVGTGTVNQPPTASFTTTTTNLAVSCNASASTDSDGSIASYAWTFGDGATASGVTAAHTYAAAGTYSIGLTVTDNLGAHSLTTKSVAVTAAPAPVPSGGAGDSGINQTGVSGRQQTGTGVTLIQNVTPGSDFTNTMKNAGATIISLAGSTYSGHDFTKGVGGSTSPATLASANNSWYASSIQVPPGVTKGLLGAGSAQTLITMDAFSSTHASGDPQPSATNAYPTNGMYVLDLSNTPDTFLFDGIHLLGTPQGHRYNGVDVAQPKGRITFSNSTFGGIPGNSGSPPGETFTLSVHSQPVGGTATFTHCTFDGKQGTTNVGAALLGTNTTNGVVNITDCLFENNQYSAAVAIWELAAGATINLTRTVFKPGHRNLGNEAQGGTINIYDPLWADPSPGEDDIRITWTSNYHSGRVNVYFTAKANLDAFFAARTNKKILTICTVSQNYGGSAGGVYTGTDNITNFCHIYVAGVEQPLLNYWTFTGKTHN